MQGKKWCLTHFLNAINLLPVHSWRNYEFTDGEKFQQKQLGGESAAFLLQVVYERHDNDSPPDPDLSIPAPICYGCKGYYPQDCPVRKRIMCQKSARIQCEKCEKNIALIHLLLAFPRNIVFERVRNKGHF